MKIILSMLIIMLSMISGMTQNARNLNRLPGLNYQELSLTENNLTGINEANLATLPTKWQRYSNKDSANFLQVFYDSTFTSIRKSVEETNKMEEMGLHILYSNDGQEPSSDQEPFAERKIPWCWFFTGFHPDYHDASDTFDRINTEDLTRIANLGFRAVWKRANE